VRKAIGALLWLLIAALIPAYAWADASRDGKVNPGNAAYLGVIDPPPPADEHDPPDGFINEDLPCDPCLYEGEARIIEFFGPLSIVNHSPSNELFLSPLPEKATVLPAGDSEFMLKLDWVNNIIRELAEGIIVDYDFESVVTTAEYRRGLLGGEFSARLPLTSRSHGVLDGIIADWHTAFGLKNGHRDILPDYMYHYTIVTREGLVYNDEGDTAGVGDLALAYKYPLWNRGEGRDAAAVRAGLKVPVGSPDKALGSGNWDFQLGALYQRQFGERWRGYVNIDMVVIGAPDWDNVGHQDTLTTLWAAEYAVTEGTTLVAQYRTQKNALRVGHYEADKDSQELSLGFNHRLSEQLVWSGGFSEDINPETAPDFVMMTTLNWDL